MNTATSWEDSIERVGIVAGCLIKHDGRYLLLQEKQPKAYGLWNFPAGHVDKGETIEQAAIREAKEESGLTVQLGKKIGIYHDGVGKPVKHAFEAQVTAGELKIPEDEILAAKWLTYDEIKALDIEGKLRSDWIVDAVSKLETT